MFRIKTISKNKTAHLSPFVFTEAQAEKKINSMKKWLTRWSWPKFEIVPVEKWPEHAVWKELHPMSMRVLRNLEGMWEKLSNREYVKDQRKEKQE